MIEGWILWEDVHGFQNPGAFSRFVHYIEDQVVFGEPPILMLKEELANYAVYQKYIGIA
jgi:hypothetical protein